LSYGVALVIITNKMIEDLQDELQLQKPQRRKTKRHLSIVLLAFLLWIPYAAVITLIAAPKIIVTVRDSGVKSYIQSAITQKEQSKSRDVALCFIVPSADGTLSYRMFTQSVAKTGESVYHDAIEGLLQGAGYDALSCGALSFIASGTTLNGLTVSQGTAFVDFSSTFTTSGSNWGTGGLEAAKEQVEKTIMALDSSIKKVVILVDGTQLSL
jgi:hypothetical protein